MRYKELGKTQNKISIIGQGLGIGGYMGKPVQYDKLIDVLQLGVGLGINFLDTAEVYGNGISEEILGKAIRDVRQKVFVATKISPQNLAYKDVIRSAEASLRRLNIETIDLYQVHWPNPTIPTADTMSAMKKLVGDGKVRYIGVSNFSLSELKEAQKCLYPIQLISNQVEYNLFDRSIEEQIVPYCEQENITIIAYSPLHRGKIVNGLTRLKILQEIGRKYNKTPAQVALRWIISHRPIVAITNTTNPERLRENALSTDFELSSEDMDVIGTSCALKPILLPASQIRVSTETTRLVYTTRKEALENPLNFVPSPVELAEKIKEGEFLKPVRLIQKDKTKNEFDLVEGRIRYWAWVIAHGDDAPIPALVDESDPIV
jgi:diketogulonate reductase-like aldo/keto reductase